MSRPQHRADPTLFSTDRRRRLAGYLALLALVVSVVSGYTALMQPQQASAAPLPGYVNVPSWTVGATATSTLPGNAAAFGNITATSNQAGQTLMAGTGSYGVDGLTIPRFLPSTASVAALGTNCVNNKPVEQINTCATYTSTVTLPHPVVDPVIKLVTGGGGTASGTGGQGYCVEGWYNTAVSGVNGGAPGTGVVTVNTAASTMGDYTAQGNGIAITQATVNANVPAGANPTSCHAFTAGPVYVQLHGLVSSFQTTQVWNEAQVSNTNNSTVGGSSIGGVAYEVEIPSADLAVTKTAPTAVASNGTINWSINVTNNGPADSHGFVIHDAVPANVTDATLVSAPAGCALTGNDLVCATAPPGCTATQNATVTTWADLTCAANTDADATVLASGASFGPIQLSGTAPFTGGTVVANTATVSGTDSDPDTANNTATVNTTVTPAPAITVAKSATPAGPETFQAGQTITYSFLVTNTGNVTLSNVAVDDSDFSGTGTLSAITCPVTTLAPGDDTTCTASYELTQADVDAGSVHNSATATGTPPGDTTPPVSPPSEVTIPEPPAPAITVVKSADTTNITAAGQTIAYSFLVTNTGNVTLSGVTVDDSDFTGTGTLSAVNCPVTTLAPGDDTTCTATYTTTQADVDSGGVTNTATATGTPPGGVTPPVSPPSTVEVPSAPVPAITVAKSADVTDITAAGQTITYSFLVTNTGNVTLSDVAVDEGDFTGSGSLSAITCPAGAASLAPGAAVTCTATYTTTQADVDNGGVTNTATATGTPPGGVTPPVSPPSTVDVPSTPAPAITVVKSSDTTDITAAGQTITYSFLVTNTGNVTLSDVAVDDSDFTGTGTLSAVDCPVTTLAPGADTTCTATYTTTQADVDNGGVTNTATATGTPPGGGTPPVSPPSTVDVPSTPAPAITVMKSADPAGPETFQAGQLITYSFVVTNTGNVTLTDVTVDDSDFSGTGTLSAATCPAEAASLTPGASVTCTATYILTQADIDAGSVHNSATATGTPPSGEPPVSPPSEVTIPEAPAPAITVVKSADRTEITAAGQTINYSFLVTNTGNVTLTNPTVDDSDFTGTGTLTPVDCPTGPVLPGAQVTCTASYTTTQADVDNGGVTNTATATGTPPGSTTPPVSPPSTVEVPSTPAPAITVVKSADRTDITAAGQRITYSFLVTNTGNVTLTGVTVDESTFTGTGTMSAVDCPTTTLAPGEDTTCTATYTVTQADVDNGGVTNTATATGTPPGGITPPISPPSTVDVPSTPAPGITVAKSADPSTVHHAGDVVTYSFTATNTGNVTLTDVTIDEGTFSGTGSLSAITCPAGAASLAPGDQVTCTASYVVTQADVDAGSITNTATATGTPPGDAPPVTSPPSSTTVTAPPAPGISIVKTVSPSGQSTYTVGQELTYSFVVTNTGNTTLTDVTVNEGDFTGSGQLSAIDCPAGVASLAPGASVTCTATYTLTQADIDAGKVTNTATATGTPPGDTTPPVSPPSTVTVPSPPAPALTVSKTANVTTITAAGQTVTYSFKVTNVGNVTITDPKVDDRDFSGTGHLSAITCPAAAASLAPGVSVTCTATYVTTAADVAAGKLTNTAVVTGTTPGGDPTQPSDPSTVTTPVNVPAPVVSVQTGGSTLETPTSNNGLWMWLSLLGLGVAGAATSGIVLRRKRRSIL